MPAVTRARKAKREGERQLRKEVQRIERAARALPGGAADHPLDVSSASVVDVKARAAVCLRCGGELQRERDQATSTPRGVLREIALVCRVCHGGRTIWFRVTPSVAN